MSAKQEVATLVSEAEDVGERQVSRFDWICRSTGNFFFLSSRWSGIRKLVFCPCGDRRDYIWVACRMQWEDFTSIVFFRHFSVSPLVRKSLSRTDFD